jgi:hypothetical protein
MAEKKEARKILCEDLTPVEKSLLLQTTLTPGFKVLVKMANASSLRATQDIIKVDPESADSDHVITERQKRARYMAESYDLLFESAFAHADSLKKQDAADDQLAEEAVSKTFGIHPATTGVPNDAVKKVFGIHPAKPKAQAQQSS